MLDKAPRLAARRFTASKVPRLNTLLKVLLAVPAIGVGVAFALYDGSPSPDDTRPAGGVSAPKIDRPAPVPSPPVPLQASATPESAPPTATTPALLTTDDPKAPITVEVPQRVPIGSPSEITVSLGANAGVSEIGFTVQLDPSVLQVRAGTKGDWAAGPGVTERFDATVSDKADRMQIHSVVTGRRSGGAGGIVAVVQIEPVGRGTTSVTIANLTARDLGGKPIASASSTRSVPITIE